MDCGGWIGIEATLKNIVVDCNGMPALVVEPSATISFNTSTALDCDWQGFSIETLFYLLLNDTGTAIKTITGAINCTDYVECEYEDWTDIARLIIAEGDDGLLYLKAGACDQSCDQRIDCTNSELSMESLFKSLIAGPVTQFVKIISCEGDCGDYFDCEHLGIEEIFRLLICDQGLRITECS